MRMYADEIRSADGIFIRGWFGDWRKVDKEKAIEYAQNICPYMTGIKEKERLDVFNEKHCKGYKVSEDELRGECHECI